MLFLSLHALSFFLMFFLILNNVCCLELSLAKGLTLASAGVVTAFVLGQSFLL